jgi:hypothetical protein
MGGNVGEAVSGTVDAFVESALGQDHLYLYLIDELTGESGERAVSEANC